MLMSKKGMSKQVLSITTKTGDTGKSGLASGERVPKDAAVFSAIGTVDELNSWLGLLVAEFAEQFTPQKKQLLVIQEQLFYLGAELAGSTSAIITAPALRKLEKNAHALQVALSDNWHTKFVFPGGSQLGAYCDVARTVCRRAERVLVSLNRNNKLSQYVIRYINRLSDYLYLLRCFVNEQVAFQERQFITKH
ncbi:MAG: ATP:cob(I)alamin adenosyltransferase [Candidatus Pacebacteria bacterium RIFCSPHIGHO2_01_FULL_46_16]|nr:MAG: ATP:cob(I)alamin adenosyltransferase [Candidatus Pacebacteria bacterium RIFCSPHIGHO2_01_FULL_46_16]OGJ21531.1 MAG: ATP:cob(I)alamin adenosyltransferase [Candidatus Pacebacteria bacterium RIFCSPHIGHO2_02_FULL_46_9]OGJ38974.1 MAG: ATP:cob(I)alamin adenosyltransferase [Candidatus Pacebacteria bacterium RIFCSPLOWO2_01_FULL_47_12]